MKQKGFTLIELLAVIVILAIIALIATPIILGVLSTAKKGGAESSALGWIDAVEKQAMLNALDSESLADGTYDVSELDVKVKGQTPKSGWITIEKGQVKDYSLVIGDYTVTPKDGNPSKAIAVKGKTTYSRIVYSRTTGGTHVGYPIEAGIDMGDKYVFTIYDVELPFDSADECSIFEECELKKFITPDLKYQSKPSSDWDIYLKHKLNDKGIIVDIETCSVYDGKEICLSASHDETKYNETKNLLISKYGESKCSEKNEDFFSSFHCRNRDGYSPLILSAPEPKFGTAEFSRSNNKQFEENRIYSCGMTESGEAGCIIPTDSTEFESGPV